MKVKTITKGVSYGTGICASALSGMAANVVMKKYVEDLPLPLKIAAYAIGMIGVIGIGNVVGDAVEDKMNDIMDV